MVVLARTGFGVNRNKRSDINTEIYSDILSASSDIAGLILTGNSTKLNSGIIVLKTKLGYILMGTENCIDNCDIIKTKVIETKNCNVMSDIVSLHSMNFYVGARLAHSIKGAFDLLDMPITYWNDSMNALWWIREHGEWSIFDSNRVKKIRKLTSLEQWKHVPGNKNPTDVFSRGPPHSVDLEKRVLNLVMGQSDNMPSTTRISRRGRFIKSLQRLNLTNVIGFESFSVDSKGREDV
ncbi:putative RNA-directed DNA polymerase from transposon X-element [Nephila pilipes]|uniref:Putative RNA-directed DNA polymerase from transposon X-element n=1 Tax=Nephila pilipes TaxID=299642 RepID=A0A8X6QJ03_NEPPI|nr:putative RNA-directed DNA polymerase from transposon X-element [Nephila pilipes]